MFLIIHYTYLLLDFVKKNTTFFTKKICRLNIENRVKPLIAKQIFYILIEEITVNLSDEDSIRSEKCNHLKQRFEFHTLMKTKHTAVF